jgi:hypothetical protein
MEKKGMGIKLNVDIETQNPAQIRRLTTGIITLLDSMPNASDSERGFPPEEWFHH